MKLSALNGQYLEEVSSGALAAVLIGSQTAAGTVHVETLEKMYIDGGKRIGLDVTKWKDNDEKVLYELFVKGHGEVEKNNYLKSVEHIEKQKNEIREAIEKENLSSVKGLLTGLKDQVSVDDQAMIKGICDSSMAQLDAAKKATLLERLNDTNFIRPTHMRCSSIPRLSNNELLAAQNAVLMMLWTLPIDEETTSEKSAWNEAREASAGQWLDLEGILMGLSKEHVQNAHRWYELVVEELHPALSVGDHVPVNTLEFRPHMILSYAQSFDRTVKALTEAYEGKVKPKCIALITSHAQLDSFAVGSEAYELWGMIKMDEDGTSSIHPFQAGKTAEGDTLIRWKEFVGKRICKTDIYHHLNNLNKNGRNLVFYVSVGQDGEPPNRPKLPQ